MLRRTETPLAFWLLSVVVMVAGGCGPSSSASSRTHRAFQSESKKIVTTCGMVTDIVKIVVGSGQYDVVGLMGEGVDPHLYKPTSNDVRQLLQADVVVYSGLMLEGRMSERFEQLAEIGKPVFAVTDGVDRQYLREPPGFEGHFDPHVWMDVGAWMHGVEFVAASMGTIEPVNADTYLANATAYRKELEKLDAYAQESIGSIPREQRILVTAHDAFGYFARAYDIEVQSVQGLSTESEAAVQDINNLVDLIVDRKIAAIFVESSVSSKNITAIIEGANARGWDVRIGGELFSDAMGKPGTYEGTYIGMIDHNVTAITRALGGMAPEGGLHGRLRQ
ncbi:MAG: zinc ABC transporter substrate-binding protein [Pirellulaceae bacterium]|nr:zinc ABC transporter substrate-binding protein [Pirellulaceae bacterium]